MKLPKIFKAETPEYKDWVLSLTKNGDYEWSYPCESGTSSLYYSVDETAGYVADGTLIITEVIEQ